MSRAERDRRYNVSEKGRARHERYNDSEKGRERWLRYYDKRMDDPDPTARALFRGSEQMRKWRYHSRKRTEKLRQDGFEPDQEVQGIDRPFH